MVAHTAFTEATDLLLKSHAWLVKAAVRRLSVCRQEFPYDTQDSLLADKFAECNWA